MDRAPVASEARATTLRFSARAWPERERTEAIRELYGRAIMRSEFDLVSESPVDVEAKVCTFPGLGIAHLNVTNLRFRRTPQHIFDDTIALSVGLTGPRTVAQRGREVALAPGEAILTTGADPINATSHLNSHFVAIRVPFKAMAALVPNLDDRFVHRIGRDAPGLRLLTGYADLLQDEQAMATPELCRSAVTHVCDLIALTLGATRDAAEVANARGARAARLHAIMSGIDEHLTNSELSAAWLGARLGLSDRYVHHLLADAGVSFSELVRCKRVERAREILEQPAAAPRRIVDVAFRVGFGDLSGFNRAFRQRFDCTPSDVLRRRVPH